MKLFYAAFLAVLWAFAIDVEAYPRGSCEDRMALVTIIASFKEDGVSKEQYIRNLRNVFDQGDFQVSLVEREEILRYVDLVYDNNTAAIFGMVSCGGPKAAS